MRKGMTSVSVPMARQENLAAQDALRCQIF
jgi:hypothetical protein